MIHAITNRSVLLVLFLMASGAAHAFVGQMAIGLGEMDENIGRIQVSFDADAKFESEEFTGNGHVYYQPGKVRDELSMGSEQSIMIRLFDTDKFYMLMPAMPGSYMEIDPDKGSDEAPEYKLISREVIGKETVNGIPTTKYKSVYESADGKFGGFTWYTDDNIAVKGFLISESKGEKQRFKFELSNLQRKKQDDALFELPPGAKPFNPAAMMGMGGMDMEAMQKQAAAAQQQAAGAQQQAAAPQQQGAVGTSTASQSTKDSESEEDGGFAGEVADEAQQSAQDAVKDETGNAVEQSIRKGFGKLFGR
jgi:hypothetical protein